MLLLFWHAIMMQEYARLIALPTGTVAILGTTLFYYQGMLSMKFSFYILRNSRQVHKFSVSITCYLVQESPYCNTYTLPLIFNVSSCLPQQDVTGLVVSHNRARVSCLPQQDAFVVCRNRT